jgi:hypothetical protein
MVSPVCHRPHHSLPASPAQAKCPTALTVLEAVFCILLKTGKCNRMRGYVFSKNEK